MPRDPLPDYGLHAVAAGDQERNLPFMKASSFGGERVGAGVAFNQGIPRVRALAWLAVAALGLGCSGDPEPGDGSGITRSGGTPTALDPERVSGTGAATTPPATPGPAPTTPPVTAPGPAPTNPAVAPVAVVIRAEKITVDRLVARLVHAEKIEAQILTVDDLRQDQDPSLWQAELASHQLEMAELEADTVYAKEIHVRHLTASQVFAKRADVKPGKPGGGKGGPKETGDDDDEGDDD